jgi:hypothetical protein
MSKQAATEIAVGPQDGESSRFELTGRDQPRTGNLETALHRNRSFAAAGGHEGAVVFPSLRLFVITCVDPRVDPAHFLGLRLSEAIIVRNVGGRVTPEVTFGRRAQSRGRPVDEGWQREMADQVRWIRSYVLDEGGGAVGTICIYEASSPEAIRKHASLAELPVNEVVPLVDTVIVRPDPQPIDA